MLSPSRVVALPGGELRLRVRQEHWPLDALCDFAARRNLRRGFLVVSRVLGRHLPARPTEMRRSARDLARLLPADLPGPVLVVGLAETAVGLGQVMLREWRALTGRDDLHYIHSTRQRLDHPLLCRFEEPHSHASAHLIYRPAIPGWRAPRSLVLVDDEITTGRTLSNLAGALVTCWPGVQSIVAASLTNWSDDAWLENLPRPGRAVSLLSGSLAWEPDATAAPVADAAPTGSLGILRAHRNRGRLGWSGEEMDGPLSVPCDSAAPLRIIGTGEFTFPPFLLAEALEREGRDVVLQATSRSPARIGGALRYAHTFADNYATDVPNYLYNAPPGERECWICHETPPGSIDRELVSALSAKLVGWPA